MPGHRGRGLVLQRRGEAYEVLFSGRFPMATHRGGASERALVIAGRMGDRGLTHEEITEGVVRAVEDCPPGVEVGTP